MSKQRVGLALLGGGFIGNVHAQCIDGIEEAELRYVHDLSPEVTQALAARFGARAAPSLKVILEDPLVDGVVIATSTDSHGPLARACIQARKAILCEKPLDCSIESARKTIALARETKVLATLAFNRRFDRQHAKLKSLVAEGRIGRLEMLFLTSRSQTPPSIEYAISSGGLLRDKGSHFFDLACWISGERPIDIYAAGECLVDKRFAEVGDVDTAMMILRFPSGVLCHLNFGRRTAYGYDERIEAFGSSGRIDSDAPMVSALVRYEGESIVQEGLHRSWFDRIRPTYAAQMAAFVAALQGNPNSLPTLEDGVLTEAIATAGACSLKERTAIPIEYK